jgi:hypothetical protein
MAHKEPPPPPWDPPKQACPHCGYGLLHDLGDGVVVDDAVPVQMLGTVAAYRCPACLGAWSLESTSAPGEVAQRRRLKTQALVGRLNSQRLRPTRDTP